MQALRPAAGKHQAHRSAHCKHPFSSILFYHIHEHSFRINESLLSLALKAQSQSGKNTAALLFALAFHKKAWTDPSRA